MGQVSNSRIVVLIICFALTSGFIYRRSESRTVNKEVPLYEALSDIKGWTSHGFTAMEQTIVEELDLDDYTNVNYSNGQRVISLYIGYYLTMKKLGAVHSPLVCMPGQGWIISSKKEKSVTVGGHNLSLMDMVITNNQGSELVLYWFQAFDKTSPGTFLQKIYALWAKLLYHREDNAFVRISIPMDNQSREENFSTGVEFIEAFYPLFLKYIKESEV